MEVKLDDLMRWKGKGFANKVKREYKKNNIKNIGDLLRPYNINRKIGRGGLKMYRVIKK